MDEYMKEQPALGEENWESEISYSHQNDKKTEEKTKKNNNKD